MKDAVDYAKAEANRENNNRNKIQRSWGSEVLSLFEKSSRFELVEVGRVVKRFPVYQDARNRINNLILDRLTDKNSRPTPQKVFTRCGDWTKVGTKKKLSSEPIPYETLLQLNIRLGPYDVLETGCPNLSLNTPVTIDPFNHITAPLDNVQGNLPCTI